MHNKINYRKNQVRYWIEAVIISIIVGFITTVLLGGSLKMPFVQYLWNMGYSLSIGLPLFANGILFYWYEKRFIDWINKPVKSIFGALLSHIVYSSIIICTVNWFWFIFLTKHDWTTFWKYHKGMVISEYIFFIIIAAICYAVSFFRAWREEMREKELVKNEALALQYKVFQNQINPHFLFNSLNVLESLIDVDTEKAKKFTSELSKSFRDVLRFKGLDIISLKEEIDFVKKYTYLQQIRFGEALLVDIIANDKINAQVIPLSLQTLVENAIKHNEISQANPLKIIIAVSDDYELIVENNLQPKTQLKESSGTGLKNLAGRYEYLTGKKMGITKNDKYFRVTLPLIADQCQIKRNLSPQALFFSGFV